MIKKTVFPVLLFLLASCGKSEKTQIEENFIAACLVTSNGDKDHCSCYLEKFQEKYPGDKFVEVNKAPTPAVMQVALAAGIMCRK